MPSSADLARVASVLAQVHASRAQYYLGLLLEIGHASIDADHAIWHQECAAHWAERAIRHRLDII